MDPNNYRDEHFDYDDEDYSDIEEEYEPEGPPHGNHPQTPHNRPSPQRETSYFKGSNGFVIDGGEFSSVSGNIYKGSPGPSGSWEHRPAPVPQQSSGSSYFENASNFRITNGTFRTVGGHVFDNSSGSPRSSPASNPWQAGPSPGLRQQTYSQSPIFAGGSAPPFPVHVGTPRPARGTGQGRGTPDNGFRNGSMRRDHQPPLRQHGPQFSTTRTPNGRSQPQLSHERSGSDQSSTLSPSPQPPAPRREQPSISIREDTVGDEEAAAAPSPSASDPGVSVSPRRSPKAPVASSTTAITGQSDTPEPSTSSAPPVSKETSVPISTSMNRPSNTMRADTPSSLPDEDINRPTIPGPAPNREPYPQPVATPQQDDNVASTSVQNSIDVPSEAVNSKKKNPIRRILRNIAKRKS
ncbi:hypothetical protein CVT25_003305 [Psilocybe cyanescens]|uniref:Uncharacterized protein n=1 Tax=Psilocybe cyanescens TaxID=93625 RepID=A0A409WMJ3_PSICY|nr:hypothetical protein CVT25_003305 [Psilocybe cyanescens]